MMMMVREYLRAFVIGSSFFVFFPFFFLVSRMDPKKVNFDYVSYTLVGPIGLGFMNMISLFIANWFHLSRRLRYFVISLLTPTFVTMFVLLFKMYNYTTTEWFQHIWKLYLLYFIICNFILYYLDKYV